MRQTGYGADQEPREPGKPKTTGYNSTSHMARSALARIRELEARVAELEEALAEYEDDDDAPHYNAASEQDVP